MDGVKGDEIDKYKYLFLGLKPPRFQGIVEPRATEDWLMRVEKSFDAMHSPEGKKDFVSGVSVRWRGRVLVDRPIIKEILREVKYR